MPRSSVSVGGAPAVAAKACNVMAKGGRGVNSRGVNSRGVRA